MGFFINRKRHYTFTVESPRDPETGQVEEAEVTVRKMTEGDIQDRQDIATRIRMGQQQTSGRKRRRQARKGRKPRRGQPTADQMQYALGELRMFDLTRSIVDWTLTDEGHRVPPTPDNIRKLDPYIAEQIHDEIAEINPSVFPQDDDEGDEAMLEAAAGSANGNGAAYQTDELDEDEPMSEDDELYGPDDETHSTVGGAEGQGNPTT